MHAKFRWDISIHGWDKTTSVFRKRMDAILEFYFQLQFSPNFQYRHVILHQPAKFRQNRTTLGIVMMSCPFSSRWRLAAILDLSWILLDHPRCDIAGLSLILNLVLIWSIVLEIWRFLFFGILAWNCLFPHIFRGIFPPKPQKDHLCAETCHLSHKAWRSIQRFHLGVGSRKR